MPNKKIGCNTVRSNRLRLLGDKMQTRPSLEPVDGSRPPDQDSSSNRPTPPTRRSRNGLLCCSRLAARSTSLDDSLQTSSTQTWREKKQAFACLKSLKKRGAPRLNSVLTMLLSNTNFQSQLQNKVPMRRRRPVRPNPRANFAQNTFDQQGSSKAHTSRKQLVQPISDGNHER